jgi:hypothetical protein
MSILTKPLTRAALKRLLYLIPSARAVFEERDRLIAERDRLIAERYLGMAGGKPLQDAILDLLSHFTPRRVRGFDKIRLGRVGDGGYVVLNDFVPVSAALSFGIATDCSWDLEIAQRGIEVYQFDYTIEGPPVHNERFHFHRKQIAACQDQQSESLGSALDKISAASGETILKIDIEGSEWEVFEAASLEQLRRLSQIVGEFHGFRHATDPVWRQRAQRVMAKLKSAFEVIHVHGNNCSRFHLLANVPFPGVIEVTLANRAIYEFEDTTEVFPTAIDNPNLHARPDQFLGSLRFR